MTHQKDQHQARSVALQACWEHQRIYAQQHLKIKTKGSSGSPFWVLSC